MTLRPLLAAGLTAGALLAMTPLALAQPARAPAAPAPAGPPMTQGPAIPGMCVFSEGAIFESSKVGQSVIARLNVLKSQVDAELKPEIDSIQADSHALDSQAAAMDAPTRQAKGAALQLRYSNWQKRAQQRQQELEATREKQLQVVGKQLEPILRSLYQQKTCSILLNADSGAVSSFNPAMDLSAMAVGQLDLKIQTLTFDREHIDANAPGAGAQGN
jgi:Skp family chaperone for outer membrane proteins